MSQNKLPNNPQNKDDALYRAGVGLMLFNKQGLVFVGERLDNPRAWQMPQGGIDEGEDIEAAALRELEEEIGTRHARILEIMEDWLYYDLPDRLANKLWNGKYKGQKQKWIALEFLGADADINIAADHHPEFSQWKWVALDELLSCIVPFKREIYTQVIAAFGKYG